MTQYFFIKKNSELPILQMRVINDSRSEYKKILENIENYNIIFSMRNIDTGKYGVLNKPALIIPIKDENSNIIEYHIGYKFNKKETSLNGTYKAEFNIKTEDNNCILTLPIRNELFVNVSDSFVNSRIINPSLVGGCNSGSTANYLLYSDHCFIITENGDKIIL